MTPEQPDRDLDKEFEDLVARWDMVADTSSDGDEPVPTDAESPTDPPTQSPTTLPGVNIWRGPTIWRPPEDAFEKGPSATLPDEDDEPDFVPSPVTLPPQEDLHFWGIVVGLVGGGLLLLYVALTGVSR